MLSCISLPTRIACGEGRLTSPESQLSSLDVLHTHPLPVQEIAQSLGPVSLVDALPSALAGKVEHESGELVDRVVHALHSSIDDVDTVV